MPDDPQNLPPESAPSDPRYPPKYPAATGKGDLHIPGAGTFGMAMLIVSLSMLFVASMVALIVIRLKSSTWPPNGMPRVPASLWISTAVILVASFTIQGAHNAIRRDDARALARQLTATFVVGVVFLILQSFNWFEFYRAIGPITLEGPYLGMFFVLTGLHAAHVIGGLIPLGIVIHRARRGRYSRNFHPGVRYAAIYWHFLDVIWVLLFCLIYF